MSTDDARPSLVHSVRLRASIEDAWEAITNPEFTRRYFFGLALRTDWSDHARLVYEDGDGDARMDGTLLEVEPGRRLRYSIRVLRDELAADLPSRVTWELEPTEDGCLLTVVHDEFEGRTPTYHSVAGGWPLALEGLKELLETGSATRARTRWPAHLRAPR